MAEHSEPQQYEGDSAVVVDGHWLCEHTDDTARQLADNGATVPCPDCGTVWAPWTSGFKRLAMPVVMRVEW